MSSNISYYKSKDLKVPNKEVFVEFEIYIFFTLLRVLWKKFPFRIGKKIK